MQQHSLQLVDVKPLQGGLAVGQHQLAEQGPVCSLRFGDGGVFEEPGVLEAEHRVVDGQQGGSGRLGQQVGLAEGQAVLEELDDQVQFAGLEQGAKLQLGSQVLCQDLGLAADLVLFGLPDQPLREVHGQPRGQRLEGERGLYGLGLGGRGRGLLLLVLLLAFLHY